MQTCLVPECDAISPAPQGQTGRQVTRPAFVYAQVLKTTFSGLFTNGAESICEQEIVVKSTGTTQTLAVVRSPLHSVALSMLLITATTL